MSKYDTTPKPNPQYLIYNLAHFLPDMLLRVEESRRVGG